VKPKVGWFFDRSTNLKNFYPLRLREKEKSQITKIKNESGDKTIKSTYINKK
jgi:hypothetical protein